MEKGNGIVQRLALYCLKSRFRSHCGGFSAIMGKMAGEIECKCEICQRTGKVSTVYAKIIKNAEAKIDLESSQTNTEQELTNNNM